MELILQCSLNGFVWSVRAVSYTHLKAFGQAIKAARTERKESRKKVSDEMYISPRYLANIENKGQQPSLDVYKRQQYLLW